MPARPALIRCSRPLTSGRPLTSSRPLTSGRPLISVGSLVGSDDPPRIAQDTEGVGTVEELVGGADRRQPPDYRVGDDFGQRRGEAPGSRDLKGPVVVGPGARVEWLGQPQRVVGLGDGQVSPDQVPFPAAPAGGGQRRGQAGGERSGAGHAGESGAEPLAVRRGGASYPQ